MSKQIKLENLLAELESIRRHFDRIMEADSWREMSIRTAVASQRLDETLSVYRAMAPPQPQEK